MFNFLQNIFEKVVSLFVGVAITIGLVSAPPAIPVPISNQQPIQQIEEKNVIENITEVPDIKTPQETKAPVKNSPVIIPQSEIIKSPSVTTKIITLPNGTIVEMDASGNIIKYITSPPVSTQIQTPPTPTATSNSQIQIISANRIIDRDYIRFEWETNLPSESKVFVFKNNVLYRILPSLSGVSTRHMTSTLGLELYQADYSYEIEAVAGGQVAKSTGQFTQIPEEPKPTVMIIANSNNPAIALLGNEDPLSVSGGNCRQITFDVQIKDQRDLQMSGIEVLARDSQENMTLSSLTPGGIGRIFYKPQSTTTAIHNLIFSAGTLTKTIKIRVSPVYESYIGKPLNELVFLHAYDGGYITVDSGQGFDPATWKCL